ncbi:MAG TPA: glycosyltransferase family 9 protein [Candidatus Aquabacterium excrementipullorum]|nr:glycosyltransferase family 9 protein [Candidatus Aquabacterium excrementipullorum]
MPEAWRQARSVLLVRLDNLGDVLMCTPALKAVRQALPHARLSLLASPSGAALAPYLPMVDEVLVHEASWVKGPGMSLPAGDPASDEALLTRLRAGRFDAAVIFTTLTQSALPMAMLCRLAGIPLRLAHVRENPYGLLSTWAKERDVLGPGMRHEVQRQLALLCEVGMPAPRDDRLVMALDERHRRDAREALREAGLPAGQPYVLLHPGATAASRRYPAKEFGEVARTLHTAGWACVFCGGPDEQALVHEALGQGQGGALDLSGAWPLGTFAALIEGARLLIGNNSGPMHMAAALGTPVVCLYALTNPQHTPWRVPSRVLYREVPCRDCLQSVCPQAGHGCLRGVEADEVAQAALALLGEHLSGIEAPGVGDEGEARHTSTETA